MTRSRPAVRALLGLSLLLLAAEGGLRLLHAPVLEFARAHRQVHRYSPEWYVDLVPSSRAHFFMPGPGGRPWLDFTLATDELGLRSFEDGAPARPGGVRPRRYVHAVGDSFTMGWGVAAREAWPALLELALAPDVHVVNLGVDGFGALGATQKSMRLAERYTPAHAVLLLVANDFADDERAVRTQAHGSAYHAWMRATDALRRHSALAGLPFAVRYWLFFRRQPAPATGAPPHAQTDLRVRVATAAELPPARGPHPSFAALEAYAEFLRVRGAGLTVLVLYQGEPFARDALQLYRYGLEHGFEPLLIEAPAELCLPVDGHLNAAGNRAAARLVLAQLPVALRPIGSGRPAGL